MGWMTQATTGAHRADMVFLWVLAIAVLMLALITGAMVYFVIRYRRARHPQAAQIEGNTALEIIWTLVPLVVFVAIFYFGWTSYASARNAPADSMRVQVVARQWRWSFQYPNEKQTTVLYAAVGRPMRLEVRSLDVIHGFFVPAFRLKIDALPGRVNEAWFQPTLCGAYDIQCTVICGVDHSSMLAKAVVVPEEAFRRWYFGGEDAPAPKPDETAGPAPAPAGPLQVLNARGCMACHSVDGRVMVGPTFRGMFGSRVEVLARGGPRADVVDEAHLRRGIQDPGSQRWKGYPPVMPEGGLSAEELDQVVAYIRSLK